MPRSTASVSLISVMFTVLPLMLVACDDVDTRAAGTVTTATSGAGAGAIQASSSAGPSNGFTGVFHATVDGTRRVVNLTERDGHLTGMIDAAAVTGRVNGTGASGDVKDPGTAVKLGTVEMTLAGDALKVTLIAIDPATGQRHELPAVTYARGAPPPIDVQRDAQLAGRWRHTWAPAGAADASGGVDGPVDVWLVLEPDGAIEYGTSKSAGDGAFAGKWRTTEHTLHVMPDGHSHWIPFARYHVEGGKLTLTYNDGSRQLYYRD